MAANVLTDFLAEQSLKPWRFGSQDCTIGMVSEWIELRTGRDPAGRFRGRYKNWRGARRVIRAEGGYVPMIGFILDEFGLERTTDPLSGDVAIIDAPVDRRREFAVAGAVMAIRTGKLWCARGLHGICAAEFPALHAWRVP